MKKRYLVLIIAIVVLAAGALTVKILFSKAETELKQLANTEIENVIKFPFQSQKQTYSSEVNTEYAYG